MNRAGIILAGGTGSRLSPITNVVSKQLLPIYDKPMIYYPLCTLMHADIRDILIVSTPQDIQHFEWLLGDGEPWGLSIQYAKQPKPEGIAQALIIAEKFINNRNCTLILGDNIFYGSGMSRLLQKASKKKSGATIFGYKVVNPHDFGVAEVSHDGRVLGIQEKPENPRSEYAVTGLYFYDQNAPRIARMLKPSKRGELEITDLNMMYIGDMHMEILGEGYAWLDAGTPEALLQASNFVHTLSSRQGITVACPEEIAWTKQWIDDEQLEHHAKMNINTAYGAHLAKLIA